MGGAQLCDLEDTCLLLARHSLGRTLGTAVPTEGETRPDMGSPKSLPQVSHT